MSNLKKRVAELIALADEAVKAASKVSMRFEDECSELRLKTHRLASLLRDVAKVISSGDFYDRPALPILDQSQQVLEKARAVFLKCVSQGLMTRFFSIIPDSTFLELLRPLQNSIENLSWLLRIWDPSVDMRLLRSEGLPPIGFVDIGLWAIWEEIAYLHRGSLDSPDADSSLISLSEFSEGYGELIIEEDGIEAAMRMFYFRNSDGQVKAARLIGRLGRHQEGVERMINAGVCPAFAKILRQGPMKVQAAVAWAVSELADNDPKWQDLFAPYNIIRFLVSHLEFETIECHNIDAGPRTATSMHAIVMMSNNSKTAERSIISGFEEEDASRIKDSQSKWGSEDPDTKAEMKAMAAKALSGLARGNVSICRSIAETRALLCFSILLDKGSAEIKYNCAMVLLEITAMAEQEIDLKGAALKPSSPVYKALVHQLQKIIEGDEPEDLIVLCIKVIGNLASTLRGMGIRVIPPLVGFLEDYRSVEVKAEASIALIKFACTDNYLHIKHCTAIIEASGVKHLIQLVCFGEEVRVRIPALILLCYISIHFPALMVVCHVSIHLQSSKEVVHKKALAVMEWASKQRLFVSDDGVKTLLLEAMDKLQLYKI